MTTVLIIGLILNAIALPMAAHRVWFLYRVISHGQPAPDRFEGVLGNLGAAIKRTVVEVLGQKKLLKWTIPGVAHAFVMYAFIILGTVYFEAYAALISRNPDWNWGPFGNWAILGFAQDLIAVLCLVGIIAFYFIRLREEPRKLGRKSRFDGSHTSGAYLVLFMIFNVLWTLFLFRAAVEKHSDFHGYGKAAFVSYGLGHILPNSLGLIGVGLLLHIGVMLVFLIDVLHSKHLHIFVAPINVLFGRRPVALGAVKPLTSAGKQVTLDDVENLDEDATLGVGSIEDFTWKARLDFASCTECGRCQSQCPAWNTEKPLSPKLLIMNLRDHEMKSAPYLLGEGPKRDTLTEAKAEAERELVGETNGDPIHPEGAVIDPDVLWSCTNCGACVNQCPVDIEHVDHIIDMRRYQVLVESSFPSELNGLFRGMENKGNPWNLSPTARMDWAQGLDFPVRVVGEDLEDMDSAEWLFWVGCAGAYEDRAKKTTRAVAELFNIAGVDFAVLGNGETCTGDSARRAGNEFVYQGLAQQNIETFKEMKVKKVVSTCPHCMNTLKNEYRQLGLELEVIHHTQLLNRLVREKKLTPVAVPGGSERKITYHDPCFLGRHNQVYEAPRELLEIIPEANLTEMERSRERSFCCGAGGARMWMEETIGERINVNRTKEAVATGADQIAVGCPFCRVMLDDGLTGEQADGNAREEVEVLDVAQMLLASVKGEAPARKTAKASAAPAAATSAGTTSVKAQPSAETPSEAPAPAASGSLFDAAPESGGSLFDAAPSGGGSLFDEAPAAPAAPAKPAASEPEPAAGGSLFDAGGSLFDTPAPEAKSAPAEAPAEPAKPAAAPAAAPAAEDTGLGGGSLFDIEAPEEPALEPDAAPDAEEALEDSAPAAEEPKAEAPKAEEPKAEAPKPEAPKAEEPKAEAPKPAEPKADGGDINSAGSLFDL
ncbi:MAG: heterodisulfide reductase-related iron-sulfur binding cluster [Marmoricola sp.]